MVLFCDLVDSVCPHIKSFAHLVLIAESIVDACHSTKNAVAVIEEAFDDMRLNIQSRKLGCNCATKIMHCPSIGIAEFTNLLLPLREARDLFVSPSRWED
jgi:hypothetical protein